MAKAVYIDKLVHVQWQKPFGAFDHVEFRSLFECGKLNAAAVIGAIIAVMGQPADVLQSVQNLIGPIAAII